MTPEGTMEKGELLAILKAAGIEKPSKAAVRVDPLLAELSRDELKQVFEWLELEELKELVDPNAEVTPEERRERLSQFDVCPCCQQWLGHNNPPAEGDEPPAPTPYRRQASFKFDR